MLDLKFWDTTVKALRPMASIHSVGKLGFNMDASKFMNLDSFPSFVIATKIGDTKVEEIFLIETSDHVRTNAPSVKVAKSGSYFYLNIKNILDQLDIDYISRISIYSITVSEENYEGCCVYVLNRKTNKPRTRTNRSHEGQHE